MPRNYDTSRNRRSDPSPPDDEGWYDRWIDSIADDAAAGMEGEPDREARLQDLRDSLNRMRRRFLHRRYSYRGRGPRGYVRSDERIREQVNECLTADPYVDATEIEVSVDEGIVTLTGTVENRAEKRLAEDCVDTVPGVRDVNNNLSIRPPAQARRREPPGPGWPRTAI